MAATPGVGSGSPSRSADGSPRGSSAITAADSDPSKTEYVVVCDHKRPNVGESRLAEVRSTLETPLGSVPVHAAITVLPSAALPLQLRSL